MIFLVNSNNIQRAVYIDNQKISFYSILVLKSSSLQEDPTNTWIIRKKSIQP